MKKRLSTIFTITVAAVLVSSIAYAAKKKLKTKSQPQKSDISEVDLAADLLNAGGDHKQKSKKAEGIKERDNEELKDLLVAMKPKQQ